MNKTVFIQSRVQCNFLKMETIHFTRQTNSTPSKDNLNVTIVCALSNKFINRKNYFKDLKVNGKCLEKLNWSHDPRQILFHLNFLIKSLINLKEWKSNLKPIESVKLNA